MQIDTSKISKTTISGFVSAAIAVVVAIAALPPHARIVVYVTRGSESAERLYAERRAVIIKLTDPRTWLKGKQEIVDVSDPSKMDTAHGVVSLGPAVSSSAKAVESNMSIKSFFQAVKADVIAMWKKAPAEEVVLASAVNAAVPYIEGIDSLLTPELAPILNPILDEVKVGLSALKSTIQGAGSSASIGSIVASINTNLTGLTAAAQVKDPATAAKIQSIAEIVMAAVTEIGASAPVAA